MNDAEKKLIVDVLISQSLADNLGDVRDATYAVRHDNPHQDHFWPEVIAPSIGLRHPFGWRWVYCRGVA